MNRATLRILLVLALLLVPSVALAEDKKALAQAEEHYKAAEVLYRLGKFKDALEQYRAAYKLLNSPNLLFNMAQCFRMLGQVDDALFHYQSFRDDYRRDNNDQLPPNIEEVEKLIIQLKAKKVIAEQKQRHEEALLEKQKREREERERVERLRQEQLAREDKHRKDLKEIIKEQQIQAKKKPPQGRLLISGLNVRGARVLVDSVPRAIAPVLKPLILKPGKYRLEITASGYVDYVRGIEIKDKKDTRLEVQMQPKPEKNKLWLASTITCFVLAAGAEALAIVSMFNAEEHYKGTPPHDQDMTLMYVGHGLAGGLAAAGITSLVLYMLSDRLDDPIPGAVGFGPAPGGGAVLSGGIRF